MNMIIKGFFYAIGVIAGTIAFVVVGFFVSWALLYVCNWLLDKVKRHGSTQK